MLYIVECQSGLVGGRAFPLNEHLHLSTIARVVALGSGISSLSGESFSAGLVTEEVTGLGTEVD